MIMICKACQIFIFILGTWKYPVSHFNY